MNTDIVDLKGRVGLVAGAGQGVGRSRIDDHFSTQGRLRSDWQITRPNASHRNVPLTGCAVVNLAESWSRGSFASQQILDRYQLFVSVEAPAFCLL